MYNDENQNININYKKCFYTVDFLSENKPLISNEDSYLKFYHVTELRKTTGEIYESDLDTSNCSFNSYLNSVFNFTDLLVKAHENKFILSDLEYTNINLSFNKDKNKIIRMRLNNPNIFYHKNILKIFPLLSFKM